MKKNIILLAAVAMLLVLASCGEESENAIGEKLLSGSIDGVDWEYRYGKAFLNTIDNVIDSELYGTMQTQDDPCSIFISGEAHLSIQIPAEPGTYSIPGEIRVVFEQEGTDNAAFDATSGIVEITAVTGNRVTGIIDASYDASNEVSGSFVFNICGS